jgi:hypothetical protein
MVGVRAIPVLVTLIILTGSGCEGAAIIPSDRPENVEASDGGYSSSILISWDAPDSTRVVEAYRVSRSGGDTVAATFDADAAARSYRDETIRSQGVVYSYRVIALFEDGSTGASFPDTGYAIESTDISIGSVPGSYNRGYDTTESSPKSDGKVWFRFLAQGGWTYEIHLTGSPVAVRLLGEEELDPVATTTPAGGDYAFSPRRSGVYYLEIHGGRGEVSVTHR